jgi:hypothetical protein
MKSLCLRYNMYVVNSVSAATRTLMQLNFIFYFLIFVFFLVLARILEGVILFLPGLWYYRFGRILYVISSVCFFV